MAGRLPALAALDPLGLAIGGKKLEGPSAAAAAELERSGVAFATGEAGLQDAYYRALGLLFGCVKASPLGSPMLVEGGPYPGAWLESTASIGAEVLSRFCPGVASSTFRLFAELAREDGLLPYKVLAAAPGTAGGPSYRQIQLATPFARSAWNHAALNGEGPGFLAALYDAAAAEDAWLAAHRDTRGSGGVEAFCAFDTGHDLSPRFWQVPDTTYLEDPARFDPDSPVLPYIAPDLTANAYCQRRYLARMARELGREAEAAAWEAKAERSLSCLMDTCLDREDECFYDVDRSGRFVRVQSDVLLRVLACEAGDDALFARACSRYLLNTRKFYASYPFTSIAMDDPRFDPDSSYNTWGGATNALSILRSPQAFDAHGRQAELSLALGRALGAYSHMSRFGQTISPFTGKEGYAEAYSPTLLGMLDAVERLVGIMPRPEGELWLTALPLPSGCGPRAGGAWTAYSRRVDGTLFELGVGPEGARAFADGEPILEFPRGLRVRTDREGRPVAVVGMVPRVVEGELVLAGPGGATRRLRLSVEPNEVLSIRPDGSLESLSRPGYIPPSW